LVELHVAAACPGELGDLGLIDLSQISKKLLRIGVPTAPVGEAVEVHGGRRRHRDLLVLKRQFIQSDRRAARDLAADVRRGEFRLVPFGIMEREPRVAHFQAAGETHELLPGGDAAELAVGDYLEAAAFLQLDHLADACVLDAAKRSVIKLFCCMLPECIPELLRAQQGADVIGAKRRGHYLPWKRGFLFSLKARTPSLRAPVPPGWL